ncbi:hypothetical protein [Nocardia sp. CA-135398]|uniref:hypothetical protein n=1 Tax=Nocardia sp. CA-135398 TaxID=3239977 RepID=UPI003D96409E
MLELTADTVAVGMGGRSVRVGGCVRNGASIIDGGGPVFWSGFDDRVCSGRVGVASMVAAVGCRIRLLLRSICGRWWVPRHAEVPVRAELAEPAPPRGAAWRGARQRAALILYC